MSDWPPGVTPFCSLSSSTDNFVSVATATLAEATFDTEDSDTDNQHFTSSANLTGTVAKTASSTTLTGTGTAFLTELSVGQIIQVPGTANERRLVTNIASNTSLTVATAFANTASGQTAVRTTAGIAIRTAGTYMLSAQIGFSANSTGTRQINFRKNGVTYAYDESKTALPSSWGLTKVALLAIVTPSVNDFFEVVVYQDSGSTLTLRSGSVFQAVRLA